MLGNLLAIFGLMMLLVIFIEYRNEKKYQEERRRKRKETVENKKSLPKKVIQKTPPEVKSETLRERPKEETPKKQLPLCNYSKFSHVRLIEMGLSDEEAKEFVAELIPQLEEQIPLIKDAMEDSNFHQIERLTHSIKGSTTNLGAGGISDLLVEYNTYLKIGTDADIAKVYFDNLVHYTNELKAQYS